MPRAVAKRIERARGECVVADVIMIDFLSP